MWGKYHQLCTSSVFKLEWKKFLEALIKISNVHFFQHLTHKVFSELVSLEFPLETETAEEGTSDTITMIEKMLFDMLQAMFVEKLKIT